MRWKGAWSGHQIAAVCLSAVALGCFIASRIVRANAKLDGSYWDEFTLPAILMIAAFACIYTAGALLVEAWDRRRPQEEPRGFEVKPRENEEKL